MIKKLDKIPDGVKKPSQAELIRKDLQIAYDTNTDIFEIYGDEYGPNNLAAKVRLAAKVFEHSLVEKEVNKRGYELAENYKLHHTGIIEIHDMQDKNKQHHVYVQIHRDKIPKTVNSILELHDEDMEHIKMVKAMKESPVYMNLL